MSFASLLNPCCSRRNSWRLLLLYRHRQLSSTPSRYRMKSSNACRYWSACFVDDPFLCCVRQYHCSCNSIVKLGTLRIRECRCARMHTACVQADSLPSGLHRCAHARGTRRGSVHNCVPSRPPPAHTYIHKLSLAYSHARRAHARTPIHTHSHTHMHAPLAHTSATRTCECMRAC